ncbi:hypothetical protein JAAARDRAFT_129275 [Jaapia argillacea MUCL 33604]|uniref:Transcription factor CBF/NF-Y/archaeal histone domain-containing protein n=1 Tax=Jaapia argillacea MUCL 33604 TaxID=933084 RepID=A0A067Q5V5_9AGAM|nr:hypothetical protein JAAARDRAFT_129275 [Jaapia argillacea MUCL 33604]
MKNKNKVTKFPVARIKRIMQKDEEVGKVAQATPIVICRFCPSSVVLVIQLMALELFLSMIIDESHKVTAERGSKRVEVYHLKHAVETVDMLDFLKEIVESVPDPSAGGTIDIEAENAEGKKKRGKGKGKASATTEEGGAAPKKRRKRKGKAEVEEEREAKEEQEEEEGGDVGMSTEHDDEDGEGYGGGAGGTKKRRKGKPDSGSRNGAYGRNWKDEDEEEDMPYMPPR